MADKQGVVLRSSQTAEPDETVVESAPKSNGNGKKIPKPTMNDIALSERHNNCWRVIIPRGVEPEDLLEPLYFAEVHDLTSYDTLLAVSSDDTWASLLLVTCGNYGFVSVAQCWTVRYSAASQTAEWGLPPGYEVRYRKSTDRYAVIRHPLTHTTKDGTKVTGTETVMQDGFTSLEQARSWLKSHASLRPESHTRYVV
jgi:hypothetical protein